MILVHERILYPVNITGLISLIHLVTKNSRRVFPVKIRLLVLFFLLCIGCSHLLPNTPRLKARFVEKGPHIDGYLNDEIWKSALPFTDFKMVLPETGISPSEKTELRILYDKKHLYIGVYCYNNDPSAIAVTDLQHDLEGEGNDVVRILLDPFQDRRNAYVFAVNAKGARTDGLATGENLSTNWDGIWEAKSKILTDGWCSEIKIPFKTISFNPKLNRWGFNLERYIPMKIETIRLSGISKDSFFYNPAEAGLLEGIEHIEQGIGLTFKPYLTMDMSQDYENKQDREWKLKGGFDLYKNFTPNLVGIFTYHTDFAETEVDDRQINLTRFPLYFPEKRSFFLEGSEIFSFGSGGGYQPAFIPFFSRRIGLFHSEQVPIDWGLKMYGKIKSTNIALLDVQTGQLNDISSNNFMAGRIYQNILSESKVGLIFTSGEPGTKNRNTLMGVDFNYSTSRFLNNKNFSAGGWAVYNWNTIDQGKHYGYGLQLAYPNDRIDTHLTYYYFGEALDPGLGFLPRGSVQYLESMFKYSIRPSKGVFGKMIRKIAWEMYPRYYWNLDGNLESSRVSVAPFTTIDTESGDRLEFFFIFHREILPHSFEIAENVFIPSGDYRYKRYQLNIRSASHRKLTGELEFETGGFYSGNLSQMELEFNFNFHGNIKLGLEGNFIHGNLPEGKFKESLYQAKADFYLNPDLGIMTFIQYDSVSENIGANVRFKWRLSPGNTIYIVYNRTWEKKFDPLTGFYSRRFFPLQDRGVFKIQLSWRP